MAGRLWTQDEVELAAAMRREGESWVAIGLTLARTPAAIKSKLETLRVLERKPKLVTEPWARRRSREAPLDLATIAVPGVTLARLMAGR